MLSSCSKEDSYYVISINPYDYRRHLFQELADIYHCIQEAS